MASGTVAPICACVEPAAGTFGFQPEMIPASLAKRKTAGPLAAPFLTTKVLTPGMVALFQTAPVGAPPGIETTNDGMVSVNALYNVDVSSPLLAIHHGDVGLDVRPHALTTWLST